MSIERNKIQELLESFEAHVALTDEGVETWFARDLQHLLGYADWRNFQSVILKGEEACLGAGHDPKNHFVDITKMVELGSGSQREIEDIMLTRMACYLIAQNGDPKKQVIAFAQSYFASQTRKAELIQQRLEEYERLSARSKLKASEAELSRTIFQQTGRNDGFAKIRSKGDQALFGRNTIEMKLTWKVPDNRPLADFAPTIILKAKDFATEITIHNAKENDMKLETEISNEHITNNDAVRKTLLSRGIRPEALPPAEDIHKVERRLQSETKKSLTNPDQIDKQL
jgi:DNA-damage-inducible protein D